jgi:hypothetical protein
MAKEQATLDRKKKIDDQQQLKKEEFDRKREEKLHAKEKEELEKIRNRE